MFHFKDATLDYFMSSLINKAILVGEYTEKLSNDRESSYFKYQRDKYKTQIDKTLYNIDKHLKNSV